MTIQLNQVQSYLYLISSSLDDPGVAAAIAASPYQMILADYSYGTSSVASDVATASDNHTKLILGYFDVTEAQQGLNPDLFTGATLPSWFGQLNPNWANIYSVQYWNPAWLTETENRIDQMIAQGFNGIYLDVAGGDSEWLPGNIFGNPATPQATQYLATLVGEIKAYVAAKNLPQPFYIIPNMPQGIAASDPAALKNFDAIFNETAYFYTANPTGQNNSQIVATPANPIWSTEYGPAYETAGVPIFGNDYPTTSNLALDFQTFALYSALGWVPSDQDPTSSKIVLENGPYMFMAVPANPVVTGTKNFVNFISGGLVANATLTGGNMGDYFIGGPGQNTISGGAGNDTIYAHPAAAALKNVLDLQVETNAVNPTSPPEIEVLINGKVALAPTVVTANTNSANLGTQDIRINTLPFGTVQSVQVEGVGLYYVNANNFSNAVVTSLSWNDESFTLSQGSSNSGANYYASNSDWIINQGGTLSFSGSAIPTTSPFLANNSDVINGGGGVNTVVYRDPYDNYTITAKAGGTWLVTSAATPEGPDTLSNIQFLQFSDGATLNLASGKIAVSTDSVTAAANLDDYQAMATAGALSGITLTDSATPTFTLTPAQTVSDSGALAAISSPFNTIVNGAAGANTINLAKTVGANLIYAHPANAGLINQLVLQCFTSGVNPTQAPEIEVLINGNVALAPTAITANSASANFVDQTITVSTAGFGAITSVELEAVNVYYTNSNNFNNIFLPSMTYEGQAVTLANATLNQGSNIPNASSGILFNNGGTATFAGSNFSSVFAANNADAITGGSGMNTVVYRDDYANYAIAPQSNGSLLVTSAATAEGPDTLTNIQHLQFADGTLVRETAAQVGAELDNLQSIAASSGLIGVTLTDSGIPILSIAASQLSSDATAIKNISGYFSLSETAPTAAMTIEGAANALGNSLVFSGKAASYTIAPSGNHTSFTIAANGVTDTVSNVQALKFSDYTLIIAATPGTSTVTTGNITELYSAVFGRLPDVPGLAYYQQELAANPSLPLISLAQNFLASPEYVNNSAHSYAQNSTGDTQFITDLYNNLLHRAPGSGDAAWYEANVIAPIVGNATPGTAAYASALALAHAYVVTDFSQSAEFLSDVQVTASHPADSTHWLVLI